MHLSASGLLASMHASHSHVPCGFLNLAIKSSVCWGGNGLGVADCTFRGNSKKKNNIVTGIS